LVRAPNHSLEANGDTVKLDERCGAICLQGCMIGLLGLPAMVRPPASQLETV